MVQLAAIYAACIAAPINVAIAVRCRLPAWRRNERVFFAGASLVVVAVGALITWWAVPAGLLACILVGCTMMLVGAS